MKKLNTDYLANELGESAFFPSNKKKTVPPAETPFPRTQPARSQEEPERPNGRTGETAAKKRIITRNSFELYEDQMDALRKLSYKEKMAGKIGSMSAMVREAIDTYIKNLPE